MAEASLYLSLSPINLYLVKKKKSVPKVKEAPLFLVSSGHSAWNKHRTDKGSKQVLNKVQLEQIRRLFSNFGTYMSYQTQLNQN